MAKSENQKLKLLYILKYLSEESDEEHLVSTQDIIAYLERHQISAERKTIYADLHLLEDFGYDILQVKSRVGGGYCLATRDFELAELKLLVDAALASKFITEKKTRELIGKLGKLASRHDAGQLERAVYVERIKNDNESIYYIVDEIHRAMQEDKQISFHYYDWGSDRKLHARREGKTYEASPFFLIWKDEYYYLVAYDADAGKSKYYRVDKMKDLQVLSERREGKEITGKENPVQIAGRDFSMFAGKTETVIMDFPEEMIGVVIDRFGKDITIRERSEGVYTTHVTISVSHQFFGWLTGLGGKVRLVSPAGVVEEYRDFLQQVAKIYDET
ncbi:MAG: WYL domain-containing protein [Lachnospiraceae bacterium]|nr:WYL domain-containing protein [Lachnospiraceae bacterium]